MRVLEYHSDQGCRKGCHPVSIRRQGKHGKEETSHYFSVDEPGAWFDDKWNCHVDGTDNPLGSREEAIRWGASVRYSSLTDKDPNIVVIFRKKPFYEKQYERIR